MIGNCYLHIRYEILYYRKSQVFWDVTVCAGKWLMTLTKIMVCSFPFYQVTQHNIPEDLNLLQHQYENRTLHIVMPFDSHVTVLLWLKRAEVHIWETHTFIVQIYFVEITGFNTLRTGLLNCLNARSQGLNNVIQLLYCVSLEIYNKFANYFCELKFSGNTHQRP